MRPRFGALLVITLLATPLRANTEFVLRHGGAPLRGGEVCFQKTDPDATSIAPQRFFFASRDVRCVPADKLLEIPVGKFLFFARHPGGYVTPHRSVLSQAKPDSEDCFSRVAMDAVPSATLDLSEVLAATPDAYVGVWVEDSEKMHSTFLPSVPGETTMLVPAGIRFVPIEIAANAPRRIGPVLSLKRGERHVLRWPAGSTDRAHVVAWLDGRDEAVLQASKTTTLDTPSFSLRTSTGEIVQPVFVPRHFGGYHGTLLIFSNVPRGPATVTMKGRWWVADEIAVTVGTEAVTLSNKPLRFAPASVVVVQQPAWAGDVGATGCDAESTETPMARAILRRCAEASMNADDCAVVREIRYDPRARDQTELEGVPAGAYVVELLIPNGTAGRETISAVAGREVRAKPDVAAVVLHGRVRKGEQAVQARLVFGTSESTATNARGEYRVALRRNPERLPIEVRFCDGTATHMYVPDIVPTEYEPFDIDIPDNLLGIIVRDVRTGRPLPAARARVAVRRAADAGGAEGALFTRSVLMNEEGKGSIASLPHRHSVSVCATAEGYERACAEPLVIPKNGTITARVELAPVLERSGRIIGLADPAKAQLYLVAPTGQTSNPIACRQDGTFIYPQLVAGSHFIVVSPDAPLTVLGPVHPPAAGSELTLELPRAPVRSFRLSASGTQSARIGMVIGGVAIPLVAFDRHQAYRGLQSSILRGQPLDVRDVAATGPIVVRLGPPLDDPTFPADAVTRPEYAGVFPARTLSADSSEVRFD